ncbi:MAG: hypothetical protein ACTSUE_09400 [Promethearchaeota archaeon]
MVKIMNLMNGIIPPGFVHLFGKGGTGKTTMAMSIAKATMARDAGVAWIDTTGGFSMRRFIQVAPCGVTVKGDLLRLVRVNNPYAFSTAISTVLSETRNWGVNLLVIDTVFGAFDILSDDRSLVEHSWLAASEVLSKLYLISKQIKLPVLFTNTMGYKPGLDQERPTGEKFIDKFRVQKIYVRKNSETDVLEREYTYLSSDDELGYTISGSGIGIAPP